jgi:cytochrome c556
MRRFASAWAAVLGLLAVAFFGSAGRSRADIDKEMFTALSAIAQAIEKGDGATAATKAKALAAKVEDLDDLMHSFKPRNKKGLGVGLKADVVTPDGIEQKLDLIAKDGITDQQLAKEGKALNEAAWMTAAIAEVTKYKAPTKDKGKKTKARWGQYANGVFDGAKDLAAASKVMKADAVKAAAIKLTNNCNSCHMYFRD